MKRFLGLLIATLFVVPMAFAQGTMTCDQIKAKKDVLRTEIKATTDKTIKKQKRHEMKALKMEWKKAGCKKNAPKK
ncbi:MAG: hypothetical protein WCQ47_06605 [bacterium]